MITKQKLKNITWIDVVSPTSEEVREIADAYEIPALVADELLMPSLKPRVDQYERCLFIILHFPALRHTHRVALNQEVDFIIGKEFIVTTRYDTIDPLHKFSKVFEVSAILNQGDIGDHAGFIFFYMLRKLYRSLVHELEFITDALRDIEEQIFEGREKEMVVELSKYSRDLLGFKTALVLHRPVLESFEHAGVEFFGRDFRYYIKALLSEYYRVSSLVESSRDTLVELRETNNSMVSTKENEVMKVIAIMAFVTFPLSLIATIFGMNTTYLPVVGTTGDFWIIIGAMLFLTACFFWFFKHKKWL